jgi:hypothetical protein
MLILIINVKKLRHWYSPYQVAILTVNFCKNLLFWNFKSYIYYYITFSRWNCINLCRRSAKLFEVSASFWWSKLKRIDNIYTQVLCLNYIYIFLWSKGNITLVNKVKEIVCRRHLKVRGGGGEILNNYYHKALV